MSEIESDISEPDLKEMIALVYQHTGITMTDKKKSLLIRRLGTRLKALSLITFREYLSYLSSHPSEVNEFINRVTTNETFFFRTQRVWDYFSNDFLPQWYSRSRGKTLKIWSAASASGEEAYSIAMLCQEFRMKNPGFQFQITATDISIEVLGQAEKGIYDGRSMNDLKARFPQLVSKYFAEISPEVYQINSEIRSFVRLSVHNLFHEPKTKEAFDIVFLRNVMIYFKSEDQEKVLRNVFATLVSGGILILGESESLARFQTKYEFIAPLIYKKLEGSCP